MRTKTLIVTVAACAVSLATSWAQVYSVNAVGYVNVTVGKNPSSGLFGGYSYVLVANPLNAGGNTLGEVLPTVPDGTIYFAFNPPSCGFGDQVTYYAGIGWEDPTPVFAPGTAAFLGIPDSASFPATITFVGEVPQGSQNVQVKGNCLTIIGSKIPQSGVLDKALLFPAVDGDSVFTWNRAAWAYNSETVYYSAIPGFDDDSLATVEVAAGFVITPPTGTPDRNWSRTFNVNNP